MSSGAFTRHVSGIGVLLVLSLLGSIHLNGQGRGASPARDQWAIVIGISNYAHAEPLLFGASDAGAFAEFLKSPRGGGFPEEQVITLLEDQATRYEILVQMESLQKHVGRGDEVYIFIAGHGHLTDRGIGYFIPSDGDLRVPAATSVPFSHLKELVELGLAEAGKRVLVTDMCHAGRIGPESLDLAARIQNVINEELLRLGPRAGGTFLNLLASRPTEASWEMDELQRGVFTHTLLEALDGKAERGNDPVVSAEELVRYVQAEVPRYTGNQQNPMANQDYDPQLPLSYLDRPGPSVRLDPETILRILNSDRTDYTRLEWMDPRTDSRVIRRLQRSEEPIEIGPLSPGRLELQLFDDENLTHSVTLQLEPGRNTWDLAESPTGRLVPALQPPVSRLEVASGFLSPSLLTSIFSSPFAFAQDPPDGPAADEARLLVRLQAGAEVFVDEAFFGRSEGPQQIMQLAGLGAGPHYVRLVESPEREYRFRVRLFPGPQFLNPETGETVPMLRVQPPPQLLGLPAGVPPEAARFYRDFQRALWEERLIQPEGNSAWDYLQRLEDRVSPDLHERLRNRLVVAMGNRAQQIVLRYLRGGDVHWDAAVFQEGAELIRRTQQLFESSGFYEAQERFFVGRAAIETAQFSEAERNLNQAIQYDPEASHAYNALGLAYWRQNRLSEAVPPLQRALELSPRWNYPRYTLALIYLEQRLYEQAEQIFTSALQIEPEDSTAYRGLGQLYFLLGRGQEAEDQLQLALQMNPGNAYACQTLGELRQRQRRWQEAEEWFRLAIRLEPGEPAFRLSLIRLLHGQGRLEEARPLLDRLVQQRSRDPEVLLAQADFLAQERPAEAEAVFRRVLELAPRDANTRVRFGLFLRRQGGEEAAEEQFRNAVRLDAGNPYAHYNLAELYATRGRIRDAERALARASQSDSRYPNPPLLLGRIRLEQKRFGEAQEAFRKALALSIDSYQKEELRDLIAQAEDLLVAQRLAQAARHLEQDNPSAAWSLYVEALREAPGSRELRNAILDFQFEHPEQALIDELPPSPLTDVLRSAFWKMQLEAETLWRRDLPAEALERFSRTLGDVDEAELRSVAGTPFNLRNRDHSIHELVFRWSRRFLSGGHYERALGLMELALGKKILGIVPGLEPLTIDSLTFPEDVEQPVAFADFEVMHHPDRRAHEIFAAAWAGLGNEQQIARHLAALESLGPDLRARLEVSRVFIREERLESAERMLAEGLRETPDRPEEFLEESFVALAEIQCRLNRCDQGRQTLRRGLQLLPESRPLRSLLETLK